MNLGSKIDQETLAIRACGALLQALESGDDDGFAKAIEKCVEAAGRKCCRRCSKREGKLVFKANNEFYRNRSKFTWCKECGRAATRDWRKRNEQQNQEVSLGRGTQGPGLAFPKEACTVAL